MVNRTRGVGFKRVAVVVAAGAGGLDLYATEVISKFAKARCFLLEGDLDRLDWSDLVVLSAFIAQVSIDRVAAAG